MSEVAKYRGYRKGYWRGYWRRRYKAITTQIMRAKITTFTKVTYPGSGTKFSFLLSGSDTMTLAMICNNSYEFQRYAQIFNMAKCYAARVTANKVDTSLGKTVDGYEWPVIIGMFPYGFPPQTEKEFNTVRGADSCLMLNNTTCKMFRRIYGTKMQITNLGDLANIEFVVASQTNPDENSVTTWNIRFDLYFRFYGTKV